MWVFLAQKSRQPPNMVAQVFSSTVHDIEEVWLKLPLPRGVRDTAASAKLLL